MCQYDGKKIVRQDWITELISCSSYPDSYSLDIFLPVCENEHVMTDQKSAFEPKVIAFVCNWCTYLGADLAGTSRLEYPPNLRIIRLPCTGRIDFNLIVKALENGADAVLVSGCHPGDCHYTSGNFHARRRWILFRELLQTLGFDTERIHFSWISAAEGAKFQKFVTEIIEKTRHKGPYTAMREIAAAN